MGTAKQASLSTSGFDLKVHDVLAYLERYNLSVKMDAVRASREWKVEVWTFHGPGWHQVSSFKHPNLVFALTAAGIRAVRDQLLRAVYDEAYEAFEGDPTQDEAPYWKGANLAGQAAMVAYKFPIGVTDAFNKFEEVLWRGGYEMSAIVEATGTKYLPT